jgi:thymidylate synthase (FAD)
MIETTLIDSMGTDLSVVNAARVSFGKKSEWNPKYRDEPPLYERDSKLIKYLAKHKHFSPFGHCFASFHVKAPIFVARQLVKHKFLRWNEISRRYVSDTPEFYTPKVWRKAATDVKQGSSDESVDLSVSTSLGDATDTLSNVLEWYREDSLSVYDSLLEAGVAPEQARMILPQSTMTEWYWSGSLDAFADMCKLRCATDTQQETRVVAEIISSSMSELFPVSWEALTKGND